MEHSFICHLRFQLFIFAHTFLTKKSKVAFIDIFPEVLNYMCYAVYLNEMAKRSEKFRTLELSSLIEIYISLFSFSR